MMGSPGSVSSSGSREEDKEVTLSEKESVQDGSTLESVAVEMERDSGLGKSGLLQKDNGGALDGSGSAPCL